MSSNGENEQTTQISENLEPSLHNTDHLSIDENNLKKRTNVSEFSPTIPSENLLKQERNKKISRENSVEHIQEKPNTTNDTNDTNDLNQSNKQELELSPSKTEIDKILSNTDDTGSILLTVTAIDDTVEEEVISEVDDDMNDYMVPTGEMFNTKMNKSSNEYINTTSEISSIAKERSNVNFTDSMSIVTTEEGMGSKLNSSNHINNSKSDIESILAEKNLKAAVEKELSFNYIDENESLFSSLVNKETLLKEYMEIRKRIEKLLSNVNDNNSLTINSKLAAINDIEDLSNTNESEIESAIYSNGNESSNNQNQTDLLNYDINGIISLSDKLMEKVIENEKINERYKKRMDDLIALKNKLIGRQRIRNNRLEFALKEALFFLQKPFDVDLVQSHFINQLISNPPESSTTNSSTNPNASSNSNSSSVTAQAKKYLKKINKKHDTKQLNQNIGPVLRMSKEENDLCMQFSINYLKQALDWIEKDIDEENDCEKFRIKRYISVDKIAKQGDKNGPVSEDDENEVNKKQNKSLSNNSINVSYSKIKINYQKGPSDEELTNEINLDDYFEKPSFNDTKRLTLKKSSTFRRDKSDNDPKLTNFQKSRSVNSLFISELDSDGIEMDINQFLNEADFGLNSSDSNHAMDTNSTEPNNAKPSDTTAATTTTTTTTTDNNNNNNNEKEKENNGKGNSLSPASASPRSNKSSHKNIPILITPLNADSEYNHSNHEVSDVKLGEGNQVEEQKPPDSSSNSLSPPLKRSLSMNAKDKDITSAKIYNDILSVNNMISVMIPVEANTKENQSLEDLTGSSISRTNSELLRKPKLLSNLKFINNTNIEEIYENFEKHFPSNQLANDNSFYFSINGPEGMELFKKVLQKMSQNDSEPVNNIDKKNFVTSIEYNQQLKKIEELEKEIKTLKYQLEKKNLEYDHEHMAKVMLDKELEDLTSQLFLQANKLVETECHKLEDTKIRLKELNDKYNNVKSQLEKRENELNGLKKMMIKNEEKKVPMRSKIFPKIGNNNNNNGSGHNSNAQSISGAQAISTNVPLSQVDKIAYSSTANSEDVFTTSIVSNNNSKHNSIENNPSILLSSELNASLSNTLALPSNNKLGIEAGCGNDSSDIMKIMKDVNSNLLMSDAGSDNMDYMDMIEEDKGNLTSNKSPMEVQISEEIQTWNVYSTKVIAIQNDKIYSYIDGGQFNEFQNYIRDSLIKVNSNKKKKINNIFCLPNTSFMKRCLEDEIYPCLFEHCSYDQQSSGQGKRNSITKTHVNFKKKLQKALSCNGIIIIPYELLSKTGKLIKSTAPVTTTKDKTNNSSGQNSDEENNSNEVEMYNESTDNNYGSKKLEYYLEYDFVHPLPLPPRKKCCLCMNYKDCHYRVFFKNMDGKDGTLTMPLNTDSSKLVNNVNIVFNNNTTSIPNTQDNMIYDSIKDKDGSIIALSNAASSNLYPLYTTSTNKKGAITDTTSPTISSPVIKNVEDYTAKCYNINSDFLHKLRMDNSASYNEQFFLCPICRDKIVSVADFYNYLSSLESKLTGTSKGQSSILNMFKNVILLKRRIATAKLGALQFFEQNNDLFKDESLSALYDNSSEEWENYVKII